jgi:hypothetical protein
MKYINLYRVGVNIINHKGKTVATYLNTDFAQYLVEIRKNGYRVGYIPAGYEHRPDLISNLFYDTTSYDWLILMFNNIKDPFQELNVDDRILIPNL